MIRGGYRGGGPLGETLRHGRRRPISGRYGDGAAAWNLTVAVPRGAAFRLPVPPGDLDLGDRQPDLLSATYERVAATTPGAGAAPWCPLVF
jgi:hypothetical protein